jgi:tetratricopeptide (TPR) repeat protein
MPRLSLCLIVRDEADMLPDFLAAAAGLCDELIAVDTGSRDDTIAILEQAGARVLAHAWNDDFAAARNASLAPATGDWILCLDADERPSAELKDQIRSLLDDDTVGAATIRMCNRLPHGHWRESDLLRLWRRDPAIVFQHPIHEEAATAVAASLDRSGRRLVNLSGRCEHLGYIRQRARERDKKERDLALLTAAVGADSRDWYSWYKLLELARFWNDTALWRETAQQVAAFLDGPPPAELPAVPWAGELLALAAQGLFTAPAEETAWLDRWEDRIPPAPAFYLRRGTAYEQQGRLDDAHRDFQRCRDLPAGTVPMLVTVRPLLGLCRIAAQRGDLLTAGDHVHQALAHNPRDPEALLAAVSFAWLNGGGGARDAFVAEHRQLHGDSEELAMAVGDHAVQSGLWDDAAAALAPVAGDPPQGRPALLLAQAWLGLGRVAETRDLCRALMTALPEAAMGYLTCCLVLGEQVEFSVDLEPAQADRAFKTWIRVLWRSRQAPLMSAFIDHFPLVGEIFPWLPAFLTEETERLKRQLR